MGFAIWLGCTVLAAALGGWLLAWFEGRWRMSERRAEATGRFRGWAIFAAGIYAGVALTTFGFQSYIRSHPVFRLPRMRCKSDKRCGLVRHLASPVAGVSRRRLKRPASRQGSTAAIIPAKIRVQDRTCDTDEPRQALSILGLFVASFDCSWMRAVSRTVPHGSVDFLVGYFSDRRFVGLVRGLLLRHLFRG